MSSPSSHSLESSASASGSSNLPRRHLSLSMHHRPRTHHRTSSNPAVPISVGVLSEPDIEGVPNAGFMHSVRRSLRGPRKAKPELPDVEPSQSSTSSNQFIGPSSSMPPPSLQEIMMGLHLSRTPHLAAPRPQREHQPPSIVISEENSPAPAFLFALMRTRAESAPQRPPIIGRRRSHDYHSPSQEHVVVHRERTRVPLPPPPAKSSLKRSSVSSDSSSLTPPSVSTTPNGRGTPSPSLSSLSSYQHAPSKLRFSMLFGRKHHDNLVPPPQPTPPSPPPRKSVRFSPSVAALQRQATSPTVVVPTAAPEPVQAPTASDPQLARRSMFARRVGGKAKGAAKDMFAVIADPTSRNR